MSGEMSTQEKILFFGRQEFFLKGFRDASLREIAAAAGVTTGAIYTYFKDKNALFEAVTAPVCQQMEQMFAELSASYYTAAEVVCELSVQRTAADLRGMYKFIYDNFDLFRLLVVGAEGSSKSDFVHTIVEHEVKHTLAYFERLGKDKGIPVQFNPMVIHIMSEGYINTILEPVRHNMSHEEALENLDFISTFYTGGWRSVLQELFQNSSP